MPAISPTVCVPVLTVFSPVDVTVADVGRFCGRAVDLQVEPCPDRSLGIRSLTTSSLPVSRVLVIVQTMSSPIADRHVQRAGRSAPTRADHEPVPFSVVHSIDFW